MHTAAAVRAADYALRVHADLGAVIGADGLKTAEVPRPRNPLDPGLEGLNLVGFVVSADAHDLGAVPARSLTGEKRGGRVTNELFHACYAFAGAGRGPVDYVALIDGGKSHVVVDHRGREGDRECSKLFHAVVPIFDHEHFVDHQVVSRQAALDEVVRHWTELEFGFVIHVQSRLEYRVVGHIDDGGYPVAHVEKLALARGGAVLVSAAAQLEGAADRGIPAIVGGFLFVGAHAAANGAVKIEMS